MTILYFEEEEEEEDVYSSFLVPFKNTILEIIFEIKKAKDWDSDNKAVRHLAFSLDSEVDGSV